MHNIQIFQVGKVIIYLLKEQLDFNFKSVCDCIYRERHI